MNFQEISSIYFTTFISKDVQCPKWNSVLSHVVSCNIDKHFPLFSYFAIISLA